MEIYSSVTTQDNPHLLVFLLLKPSTYRPRGVCLFLQSLHALHVWGPICEPKDTLCISVYSNFLLYPPVGFFLNLSRVNLQCCVIHWAFTVHFPKALDSCVSFIPNEFMGFVAIMNWIFFKN